MIHWAWLIPTFIFGGLMGVFVMCLAFVSKRADENMNKMEEHIDAKR